MNTKVIHIKDAPSGWKEDPQYVYIGRPNKYITGPFGNPFPSGEDRTREESIEAYRRYAEERIAIEPGFNNLVAGLRGKTLLCYCKPKACHGDVLAELAEVTNEVDLWDSEGFFDGLGI